MSISVGAGQSDLSALQRQLRADQKALELAEKQHASQTVITADEAKVQVDQQAIAAAGAAKSRANAADQDTPSTSQTTTGNRAGTVPLYL